MKTRIPALLILLSTLFISGCGGLSYKLAGPMPEVIGIGFTGVSETPEYLMVDCVVYTNSNTEKVTVLISFSTDGYNFENGPAVNNYFDEEVRRAAEDSNDGRIGVAFGMDVSHQITHIKFDITAMRGPPDDKRVLWSKQHQGSRTYSVAYLKHEYSNPEALQ